MGFSGFSASLCVVGLILVLSGGGCEGKANDDLRFITWSDFTARRARPLLTVKCRNNTTKVIVVDKNGGGDSDTIQGAVDMVPVQNKQRVKIQIRPGIYRSVNEKVVLLFVFHFLKKETKKKNSLFFNLAVVFWDLETWVWR